MAIYKPTYCYPYSENIDLHIDPETKAIYVQCQINTNNKKVTGYRLSLVDKDGQEVWAPKDIMPITSIQSIIDYGDERNSVRTGLNGDTLIVPFVQDFGVVGGGTTGSAQLTSQCLYTKIDQSVDYYFFSSDYDDQPTNWTKLDQIAEVKDWNTNADQNHQLPIGAKCLVSSGGDGLTLYEVTTTGLSHGTSPGNGNFYIKYGNSNHGTVKRVYGISISDANDWLQYLDSFSNGIAYFKPLTLVEGQEYSWQITLYQGEVSIINRTINNYYYNGDPATKPWQGVTSYYNYGTYSTVYNDNQYDILITQGQILGSTGTRLQIYPTDVVLQKYWVQLGKATRDANGIVLEWKPFGNRSNIQIYDSTYGHIYPQDGDFQENIIEQNPNDITDCIVYKHSNNVDDVLASDKVKVATPTSMTAEEIDSIITDIFGGGLPTIDGYQVQQGDRVLLKDLKNYEYLNGVYVAYDTGTQWKRAGDYADLGQYIGKVVMVENGAQNAYQNFESTVSSGGSVGRITGSGVDAIRPSVAAGVFAYSGNEDRIESYYWLESSNQWISRGKISIEQFITDNINQDVVIIEKGGSTLFPNSNNRYPLPGCYTVMLKGTTIPSTVRDAINNNFESKGLDSTSILWVSDMVRQTNETNIYSGFLSFDNYSDTANTYKWEVNSLSTAMMGSPISFRPEQGIVLYPNFENVSSTAKSADYIWIGDQQGDSSNGITSYILQCDNTDTGSSPIAISLSNKVIDGTRGEDLGVNTKFISYRKVNAPPNYTQDISKSYPARALLSDWPIGGTTTTPECLCDHIDANGNIGGNQFYLELNPFPGDWYLKAGTEYGLRRYWYEYVEVYGGGHYEVYYEDISTDIIPWGDTSQSFKIRIETGAEAFIYTLYYDTTYGNWRLKPVQEAYVSRMDLGYYTVQSNGTTALFTAYSDVTSGTSASSPMPVVALQSQHGLICGGNTFLTSGTWGNPLVQLGITSRVAKLNINNSTTTYIKPSLGIEPGQYMVFTEVNSPARQIATIDTKQYGVTFMDNSATVYSSVKDDALKTPYKYNIMSYFKTGDYNPFIFNGDAKIGFANMKQSGTVTVPASIQTQTFILDDTIYSVPIEYDIAIQLTGNDGFVLNGFFSQGNGQRWRSYRMAIFNENGDVLQDSQEVYDGDISQTFWGIKNIYNEENRSFYAMLIVEDYDNGKYVVGATMHIMASEYPQSYTGNAFSIQYNYNLHSIDIKINGGLTSNRTYTIYRQEYVNGYIEHTSEDLIGFTPVEHFVFDGTYPISIRDYNITNGRKYRYFIQLEQPGENNYHYISSLGFVVETPGKCWSIAELIPQDAPDGFEGTPTVRQYYAIDENNVWVFKYNAEFGSQTQGMSKTEHQTLGKYPQIGHGLRNNISGQISALLGSEIRPGTYTQSNNQLQHSGYRERLRNVRVEQPTAGIVSRSSNDSVDMLEQWRKFVHSKNPKLLKDVKGQSWIVQIMDNQNTPKSQVDGRPDTISFSWIQINDPKNMIITGDIQNTLTSDY